MLSTSAKQGIFLVPLIDTAHHSLTCPYFLLYLCICVTYNYASHLNTVSIRSMLAISYFLFHCIGVIDYTSLMMYSFTADPPSFTLIGDTRRGPPVTNTWTRNGEMISDGGSYSISLAVNEVNRIDVFESDFNDAILRQSRYHSTLTVTGNLPGVYVYSVINRAMSAPRTASFTIEGNAFISETEYTVIMILQVQLLPQTYLPNRLDSLQCWSPGLHQWLLPVGGTG